METFDAGGGSKWKLKNIKRIWFLDVGGKLKRLKMLDNESDVSIEENIIFADNSMYQLTEEDDGEITLTEIKDIRQVHKPSECKQDDRSSKKCNYEKSTRRDENLKNTFEMTSGTNTEEDTVLNMPPMTENEEPNEEMSLVEGILLLNSHEV